MSGINRILHQFTAMVAAQVVGTGLGFLFWVLVAREVSATNVGIAAAAINTQTMLGNVAMLGLGTYLLGALPPLPALRQRRLLVTGLSAVVLTGVLIGALTWAFSPVLGHSLDAALADGGLAAAFAVGVAATAAGMVLDQAALGLNRAGLQVVRNLIASGLRFPMALGLLALGLDTPRSLMVAWVLPVLISAAVLWLALRLPRAPRTAPTSPSSPANLIRAHGAAALSNHGLNLSLQAGPLLVPVVAALALRPAENAEFTMAWLIATFAFMPPYLLATSLFAATVVGGMPEFVRNVKHTFPGALALSAVLCVGAWLGGPLALRILGGSYAEASSPLLDVLVLGGLWAVVKDHLIARARIMGRLGRAASWVIVAVGLELTGAVAGAVTGGSFGLAVGWVAVQAVEAVVVAPVVVRLVREVPWRAPKEPRAPHRSHQRLNGRKWTMSKTTKEVAGTRTVLALAAFLLVAGVAAGIVGLKAGGGKEPLHTAAAPISCIRTDAHPGPRLDLGVQPAGLEPNATLSKDQIVRLVGLAKRAGASVISTAANWSVLQPTSAARYDWADLDEVIDVARAAGLDVRLVVGRMPAWAVDKNAGPAAAWRPPLSTAELTHWSDFVDALTRHVRGRVDYFEVWTEPDQTKTWSTGPDATAYARLLGSTYPVVKELDPRMTVITGGLSNNDLGYLGQLYKAITTLYGKDRSVFDMVGVHPYSGDRAPRVNEVKYNYDREPYGDYDQNFLGFRRIHAEMAAHGDGDKGIYLGEFGYSTAPWDGFPGVPDAVRATYVGQAMSAATCYPYVKALSWYYLHPTRWDPASWTLLDSHFVPNRTYAALAAWARAGKS